MRSDKQRGTYLRFIDLTTKYHITRDRLYSAISISCILIVSAAGVLVTKTVLDNQAQNDRLRRQQEAERLAAATTESVEETTETTIIETEDLSIVPVIPTSSSESSDTEGSSEDTEETSGEDETTSEQTSETTTEATTTTTTAGPVESELYMTVYADGELNLRTGPGTEYDLVRVLTPGDAIDVVAVTDNGWYRTYNGNYVSSSHTTTTPPAAPSTVPQTEATAAPTAAPTTAAPVETQGPAPAGSTTTCTITFYGPQPLGDGTYSTTTATGSTCTQGRTCAADWSIYPPGTVIYIANDPLGGDGYYTVEDRGPGVNGNHIDIYVDDVSAYSTTSRDVSVA